MSSNKFKLSTKTVFNRRNRFVLPKQLIQKIRQLSKDGFGVKYISRTLCVAPQSVRKYRNPNEADTLNKSPVGRPKSQVKLFLEEHRQQVLEVFIGVNCNSEVAVRRLREIYGQDVHVKMLNRFVQDVRTALRLLNTPVTGRFETEPGAQMQIDFGELDVTVAGKPMRAHFFVAVLGYSRRIFVKAYERETQDAWLNGIEEAFRYFGGLPSEVVSDNARTLVTRRTPGEAVRFTDGYKALCDHYGVRPVATAVRKPRSKGKVERAVSYVKRNALVNLEVGSMDALNAWLLKWCGTVADERMLSHFKQRPSERWLIEKEAMKPLSQPPLYGGLRMKRKVDKNGLVRIENRYYRVPDGYRNRTVELFMYRNSIDILFGQKTIIKLDKTQDVYSYRQQPASSEPSDDTFDKRLEECRQNEEWTRYRQSSDELKRPAEAYEAVFKGSL